MMQYISIILPSYNYAHHLREAVDSILAQSYAYWELVIVDDGSLDNSFVIAEEYAARDERIRVLRHPDGANHGLAATMLLGLEQARHDTVAFLEADDAWEPESLAVRLEVMQQPGAALVFNAPRLVVEAERDIEYYQDILATLMTVIAKRRPSLFKAHELMAKNLIPSFSCVMAVRDMLLACDFMPPSLPYLDKWLWQQLSLCGACHFTPLALTRWRLHGQSYISTYAGDVSAEERLWRKKVKTLLTERPYEGLGIWLAGHAPALHSVVVRAWLKARSQGVSGLLRAIRKRMPWTSR
jgi:glycosyltransferase involved in cell wall biosynthesis